MDCGCLWSWITGFLLIRMTEGGWANTPSEPSGEDNWGLPRP